MITSLALLAAAGVLMLMGDPPATFQDSHQSVSEAASAKRLTAPRSPDGTSPTTSLTTRTAVPGESSGGETAGPVGTLRFGFVAPEGFDETPEVRLLSGSRFATQEVDEGTNELPLSPGRYAFTVLAKGFDPIERAVVDISPGKITELGQIRFLPGTGTIQGYVTSATPLEAIEVELVGVGRHPCHACRSRGTTVGIQAEGEKPKSAECVGCGYGEERSALTINSGERFLFSNLSHGAYRIRARHRDVAIADERLIELAPGGHSVASLTIYSTTSLEVQLAASGALIEAGQASELETSSIRFRFKRIDSDEEMGTAKVGPREINVDINLSRQLALQVYATHSFQVSSALNSEIMLMSSRQVSRQFVFDLIQSGQFGHETNQNEPPKPIDPIDRPRVPEDSLYTETERPEAQSHSFSAEWLGPRRVRIHDLPRDLLMLEVRTKNAVSGYAMIDLRFGDPPVCSAILDPQAEEDHGDNSEPNQAVRKIVFDLNNIDTEFIQLNPITGGTTNGQIQVPLRIEIDS